MSNQTSSQYQDTIPLSEGITLTTNWRNYIGNYEPADQYIRAFNIPMEDIKQLATFTSCPSVRAYLAMGTPGNISSLKVIIVPVDAKGNDITSVPVTASTDAPEAATQSTIFDFSSPCPQTCDVNSPLFD